MSEYREQFENRLPALNAAIENMPGSLDQFAPGLTKQRLKSLFQRITVLLGRLDKRGATHPEFLVYGGQPLPQYLISFVDTAISHMGSGAATFAGNSLPVITAIFDLLNRALGTDPEQLKRMSSSIAADLGAAVERSDEALARVDDTAKAVAAAAVAVQEQQAKISQALESAQKDQARVGEARRNLEQLLNPDGRNRSSLESLVRRARERITEVEEASKRVSEIEASASSGLEGVEGDKKAADDLLEALLVIKNEANQILNLSSQAGLAASYKTESDRLHKQATLFTYVLYGTALLTLPIAAFWVIPGLERAVARNGETANLWDGLAITLLRASVLAPLVYILYFTTKRISALETLRMDYTEKAAASLSYSGYKDQMTADGDLLRQLKASLLIKFAEHPERLLRPKASSTSARVKTPGFEAESTVNTGAEAVAKPASPKEE